MSETEYEEDRSIQIPPAVYGIATLIQNVALGLAGLAALYLLYGLFFGLGGFSSWEAAKQKIMIANLVLGGKWLMIGLAVASVCAVLNYWYTEITGYVMLVAAAIFWFGLPFAFSMFGGNEPSAGAAQALAAFPQAAIVPAAMAGILIVKDMVFRFSTAIKGTSRTVETKQMTFGADAERARQKPVRTSLIGKCWEGSYCRDWVRPHCPIYQKREACWKNRRGCYCEQDIVSAAATKVQGVQLEMAPASQYNYANPATTQSQSRKPQLTPAQKVERCRNCVIYNDHQAEKYKVLMPIVMVGTIALCALLAPVMRLGISGGMTIIENLAGRLAFTESTNLVKLSRPGDTVQWALVGAFSLMIISKMLQIFEWCIYTKKL